ncbi:nucleoside phosphatase GDA1/CD39 [Gallaecimonas xiamenensis]|uniref:Nucleoside phosphatase GDA1/CD39 n=1 Tax=Gallaecimonas xiamenensis 3-C-1 TaxID=745411 RepID=K2J2Y6_9GAMM|nr:nucleoside phosphatase GDA1/CD39 [Gallaecimonas xiamenensis]EKE69473.1 nucleoside phosphatase GDA1/CD39 [Gallaecimonas xiamenensis 3-C-1]
MGWIRGLVALLLGLAWAVQAADKPACRAVFDAGSSGTRLFLYVQQEGGWQPWPGAKLGALADPVRQHQGPKAMAALAADLANSLEALRQDGPTNSEGQPRWQGFDWQQACRLQSVSVLATAGMRLAEQQDPVASVALWQEVQQALAGLLGPAVAIDARTLTGFEEGFYAWLAARARLGRSDMGIVEMGGASSQVAFPCPACDRADDAVQQVRLEGQTLDFYSYSFLGLGQDEAPKVLGVPHACRYGAGVKDPNWQLGQCQAQLPLTLGRALKDPYNFQGQGQGGYRQVPTEKAGVKDWLLTGAFQYNTPDQLDSCCLNQGQCYQPSTACFRVAYLPLYLDSLGVDPHSPDLDVSWTLGAVLCRNEQCLAPSKPPCRWRKAGCLAPSVGDGRPEGRPGQQPGGVQHRQH